MLINSLKIWTLSEQLTISTDPKILQKADSGVRTGFSRMEGQPLGRPRPLAITNYNNKLFGSGRG